MSSLGLPPGSLLILGSLLFPLLRGRAMQAWLVVLPLLSYAHLLWGFPADYTWTMETVLGTLTPIRIDRLAMVWGHVFHIAAFLAGIFAMHVERRLEHWAGMTYAGAAIAAVFAGDLLSLFVFWELTALSSVFLIWASDTRQAYAAGMRYLLIQVCSGVLLLAAVVFRLDANVPLNFDHIGLDGSLGAWLVFFAFAIKAAFPFLHNWLQDAYPASTATGTVFLSSFTTKLAIYALARGFAGTEILIWIGAAMTLFPIFYAVIENDLRKVLAYSLNNQLGYMVVGIGIGTELALNGTAAHAFAHIIYKGLLFMAMGAVLMRTGTTKGSELGGLYKSMPWTTAFCLIGAASISGFPLFSGFVTKSMIVSATGSEQLTFVYLVLLFASAGVFHHSGIKIPYFAFFAHDSGKRPKEAPLNMLVAMGLASVLCIALGLFPNQLLYPILPYPTDYVPYTADHIVSQMQLLLGSALAFGLLQRAGEYPPELRSTVLDTDWIYRRWLPVRIAWIARIVASVHAAVVAWMFKTRDDLVDTVVSLTGPSGRLARPPSVGDAALSVAVLLTLFSLIYFEQGIESHAAPDTHNGAHEAPDSPWGAPGVSPASGVPAEASGPTHEPREEHGAEH